MIATVETRAPYEKQAANCAQCTTQRNTQINNPPSACLDCLVGLPDTNDPIARVRALPGRPGGCQAHSLTVHHGPRTCRFSLKLAPGHPVISVSRIRPAPKRIATHLDGVPACSPRSGSRIPLVACLTSLGTTRICTLQHWILQPNCYNRNRFERIAYRADVSAPQPRAGAARPPSCAALASAPRMH